jgi:glutamate synthase (NADPH/NADH) large chain/glutamate synthase (ferredoxin)
VLQDAKETIVELKPAFRRSYKVTNVNRNLGTRVSGEIAYLHGNYKMNPGTIRLDLRGSAGQGLGTFLVQGLRIFLEGDANDYVGKGMNGGEIIIRPGNVETYAWHENTLIGNTCLYGATGGALFAAGQAGERFGVRNSGATAVVEGVGDHACEYMTGGTIVCLGDTGRNFGAGMSGGIAFVYDPGEHLMRSLNPDMVEAGRLDDNREIHALHHLIELHAGLTGSHRAGEILANWDHCLRQFQRIAPKSSPDAPKPVFSLDNPLKQIAL